MSYSATILADSPVVYYRLGEGSGTSATDSSGNSHTGTYTGSGVTYGITGALTGDADTAASFNGSTGYMDSGVDSACNGPAGDFSVEIWIKTTQSALMVAMGKVASNAAGDDYWIGANLTAHKASFNVQNTDDPLGVTVTGSVTIDDGNWHHLVGVRDGTTLRLYVDGAADGTASVSGASAVTPTGSLVVGKFGQYALNFQWNGSIDEAAFYASKLTAARVLAHYNAGVSAAQSFTVSPATISPRSTGTTLTLTGTNTAWDGTTVFTVSGAGATKTGQSVIGNTSATVTVDTSTSSGTVTVTETVTGTGSSATTTVLTYKKVLVTSGGVDIMLLEPAAYVSTTATPLVFYHHGVGEDRTALISDALKTTSLAQFLSDGYLLAGISAGENWGNQTALDAYSTALTYISSNYKLRGVVIWSQSMGGCAGLLNFGNRTLSDVRGWLGTYPVCNLADMYGGGSGTFASAINTAYSISGNYSAQTAGHDPVLLAAARFNNRYMRFYASTGDTIVNSTNNSTQMQTLVSGVAQESTLVVCSGDHGDTSHFQPSDYSAFVKRALRSPATLSGCN